MVKEAGHGSPRAAVGYRAGDVALTDSLTKVGVTPRGPAPPPNRAACAAYFEAKGRALQRHDVRWGGALHYAEVGAR